jgi:hypothetical protein
MTTLKPMTDAHAAEILDKLIVELAFVAENADVRAEKTAQQYAAMLSDFIQRQVQAGPNPFK